MSRLKSGRGADGGRGGRSSGRAPTGGGRVLVQSARSDVYVALLGVSLGAMFIGLLFLVLLLNRYEFKTKVSARPNRTADLVAARTVEGHQSRPAVSVAV